MVHTCVEESADVEYVHEYRLNHGCKRAVHEYVSDCKRAHSGPSDGKARRPAQPRGSRRRRGALSIELRAESTEHRAQQAQSTKHRAQSTEH